ncbi:hypothetical protein ACQBAT_00600 [Ornithinimicrobium sp. Y1847]|uniref:hypothetical protein n=1 Tax=Ornithinimicrobium sp. Y1847 TaxID=3405419 RepID=UPI003B6770F8
MSETDGLERLRVHTRVDVGDSCGVETMVHSVVLRANRDGARRMAVYFYTDNVTTDGQQVLYELGKVIGGTIAEQVEFAHLGATAAVIVLDEELSVGQLTTLSVEWVLVTEPATTPEVDCYQMRSPWPIGHLGLEVRFLGQLPATLKSWAIPRLDPAEAIPDQPPTELVPIENVQVSVADVVGGGVRVEWQWRAEAKAVCT